MWRLVRFQGRLLGGCEEAYSIALDIFGHYLLHVNFLALWRCQFLHALIKYICFLCHLCASHDDVSITVDPADNPTTAGTTTPVEIGRANSCVVSITSLTRDHTSQSACEDWQCKQRSRSLNEFTLETLLI
jgi:hypothetical protein